MKTLVFCTSYARTPEVWRTRYRLWANATGEALQGICRLIIDDGSLCMPDWTDAHIISTEAEAPAARAGVTIFRFSTHLGRQGRDIYPGWFRSFMFAARYAHRHTFDRVVHIESDTFLISQRAREFVAGVRGGWVTVASETHPEMPESCIQVMAGTGLSSYLGFSCRSYGEFAGRAIEPILPFSRVDDSLRGGRYGQVRLDIPRHADWASQMHPEACRERGYYWWLPDRAFDGVEVREYAPY